MKKIDKHRIKMSTCFFAPLVILSTTTSIPVKEDEGDVIRLGIIPLTKFPSMRQWRYQ